MKKNLAIFALASVLVAAASAQSYSTGFDSMNLGALVGQDGWVAGSNGTMANAHQITNNQFLSPSNSALIEYTGTGGTFVTVSRAFAPGAVNVNNKIFTASADIYVERVAGNDRYFGFGFGTSGLATTGILGAALGGNGLRGGGGSYGAWNDLNSGLLQARTTNDFVGRWVRVSLVADRSITTNNIVISFSGLGTSGGASTASFTRSANLGTQTFTHFQIVNDWGTTSTVHGTAYVDNVSYAAVPEPGTLLALGAGAVALLRRRRKSA